MKKLLLFTLSLFLTLSVNAQTWQESFIGYTADTIYVDQISIGSAQDAWGLAQGTDDNDNDFSVVVKTSDRGQNWTTFNSLSLPGTINPGLGMVYSAGGDVAYIAAYKNGNFGSNGVWKTVDGGQNWTKATDSNVYNSNSSFTNIVYFFDAQNGITTGDPGADGEFEIYLTTDAGATWTKVPGADIPNPLASDEYGYVRSYATAGNIFWFTTGYGRIFKTTDMGHTWTAYQTPIDDFGGGHVNGVAGKLTFKNENEGWVMKNDATLYHTTDGGQNWNTITPAGTGSLFKWDFTYVPGTTNKLMSVGINGAANAIGSSFSLDGGLTWENIDTNERHTCIEMVNDDFGYSGGVSYPGENNGVYTWVNPGAINNISIEGLRVYPNPARDILQVSIENSLINNISIIDLTGKQVISINEIGLNVATINTSNLESGIYIIKVTDKTDNTKSLKLIIK